MLRSRRRRVVVQPVLAVGIATLETAGLLTVVRLILLLVQRESTTTFAPPGAHIELTFVQLGLVGVACAVLAAGLRVVEGRYNARTIELAVTGARNLVIDAFLGSDWEEVRQRRVGSLQQQLGVNAMQAGTPVTLLAIVSLNGLQLLMFLALILAIAPQVAVMFGLLGLVATATMTPLRKASRRRSRAHAAALADLQLSATSYSLLGRELALFGVARAAAAELKAVAARTGQQLRGVRALARIIPGLYQQVLLASVVLIVLVAERLDLDATAFGTAAILGVRSLSYLQAINNSTVSYLESQPMLDDLLHTVRLQRRSHRTPGTRVLDRVSSVELTDVGYRYSDGTLALDGINLRVSAGEWIGIVGPSGAGKTTLANILVGLTQPTSGTMLVNGIAAAEFDPDSWARQFALVTQEPTLLRATVRENVAFYRSRDEARVIEAAADAGVRDEIELLPQGFDTPVGDGNATLSGGQRQRVAIARALLDRPSCLLLDEPTSALDAANEALIEEALLRIDRDTIVVIVSHRPKLLERCDRIVNLENGRLEPANA